MCACTLFVNVCVCVCVYPLLGFSTVANVVYDDAEKRFTCTSIGPATIVTWRRNCIALPNSANFLQAQTVTSTLTATYSNTLTIGSGVTDRDGVYTCTVTNIRGLNSRSAGLGGKMEV